MFEIISKCLKGSTIKKRLKTSKVDKKRKKNGNICLVGISAARKLAKKVKALPFYASMIIC